MLFTFSLALSKARAARFLDFCSLVCDTSCAACAALCCSSRALLAAITSGRVYVYIYMYI